MTRFRFNYSVAITMLVLAGAGAMAQNNPDARARATEKKMTDDERFQLLLGYIPIASLDETIDAKLFEGIPVVPGFVRGIPRLGIPNLLEADASLGIANPQQLRPDRATALPSGLAIAASFNPAVAYAGGRMVGSEARALGYNVLLGGGVNLTRDPRNGRNFEYLGEDPLLAGTLAGEAISGTQSVGVISTVKHFSLNAQETLRDTLDARIDEKGHRESDLLAFQFAIERGQPGAVMCGYNLVNGDYACGNDHLLNKVLKEDWGYKGWVMSDWEAVHEVSYFNAGLDQQSGPQLDKKIWFDQPLKAEYAAGRVSKERLSDAVRRILRSIYAVGADQPVEKTPIDFAAHAKIARDAAAEGIVLLKNDGILPLAATAKSIAVIGGYAHIGVMSGGGSSQVIPVGDPAGIIPIGATGKLSTYQLIVPSSPLEALQTQLPKANITYQSGYDLPSTVAGASKADVAVVFATQWQREGFDGGMMLPGGQDALIEAVAKVNPNTIVVLETGNPVHMPWLAKVSAVVEAWYPGQEGGKAIADVLTGKVNPSGRLPLTWPVDESQNPRPVIAGLGEPEGTTVTVEYTEGSNVGYRWFHANNLKPLFSFGHGLSYTSFKHGPLDLTGGETVTAQFTVTNSGSRAGADVPQLYLVDAADRPIKRLVGFDKVMLTPGESRNVSLPVDPRLLADWNGEGWTVSAGEYRFALGKSASDLGPTASVKLAGRRLKP
jgi:beta-glucosidase